MRFGLRLRVKGGGKRLFPTPLATRRTFLGAPPLAVRKVGAWKTKWGESGGGGFGGEEREKASSPPFLATSARRRPLQSGSIPVDCFMELVVMEFTAEMRE